MNKNNHFVIPAMMAVIMTALIASCGKRHDFTTLFTERSYPYATFHNGTYYYMMQEAGDSIILYATKDLRQLPTADHKVIWTPSDATRSSHVWSPELHLVGGKWYVYFEADDGNTDNHQIYVIENPSDDPMKGVFTMKGVLKTNDEWNWGIHPSTFVCGGKQYLVWSGWPRRRSETETQCIFIASMSNPWTVSSERVMISQPRYEWERQWINPDGSRSAYPIYVNENPEPIISPDGKRVYVYYSASGCWTLYSCLGMVYADTSSDLLNPASWHKDKEPVFKAMPNDSIFAPNDISVVGDGTDNRPTLLYETKRATKQKEIVREIRMKSIDWKDLKMK